MIRVRIEALIIEQPDIGLSTLGRRFSQPVRIVLNAGDHSPGRDTRPRNVRSPRLAPSRPRHSGRRRLLASVPNGLSGKSPPRSRPWRPTGIWKPRCGQPGSGSAHSTCWTTKIRPRKFLLLRSSSTAPSRPSWQPTCRNCRRRSLWRRSQVAQVEPAGFGGGAFGGRGGGVAVQHGARRPAGHSH